MKLLVHNMLTSNMIKGVTKGFPLGIEVGKMEEKESEFSPNFISRMVPKLDWEALLQSSQQIGKGNHHAKELPCFETGIKTFLRSR